MPDAAIPWLAKITKRTLEDLPSVRRHSSGSISELRKHGEGCATFRTDADSRMRLPACGRSGRLTLEVRLSSPEQGVTLSCQGASLRIMCSPDDDAVLYVVHSEEGREERLTFRFRPDFAKWGASDEEREGYRRDFQRCPGWPSSWIRLALDLSPRGIRFWLQGRFIAEAVRRHGRARALLEMSEGVLFRSIAVVPLPASRYVPLDLVPYAKSQGVLSGDLGDGYGLAADLFATRGAGSVHSIPFQMEWGPRWAHVDVGRTLYRGKLPYVSCDSMTEEPGRLLLRVPKGQYSRIHLICASDTTGTDLPFAAVRMMKTGRGHASTSEFGVPRWDEEREDALRLEAGRMIRGGSYDRKGSLWLVSVPLNPGEFLEFLNDEEDYLEIDITRRVACDDETFPRPAGPASSVHLFAATLELAPAKLVLNWDCVAPVYEAPASPKVRISVQSQREEEQEVLARISGSDPYGSTWADDHSLALAPLREASIVKDLPRHVFGKFDLRVSLRGPGGWFADHTTSYAFLPRDERRAGRDSPFGMWCFFEVHNGLPPESAARLMRAAGVRWTLPGFLLSKGDAENRERLKVLKQHKIGLNCGNVCCIGNTCCETPGDPGEMLGKMDKMPRLDAWMVFWETSLGRRHRDSFPPQLLGRPPLRLTDEEERYLRNCWQTGTAYSKLVRERYPGAKLIFGNGFPAFIGAMLERGYPREYIDAFGLDFDLFTSMPERQIGPLYSPFYGIHVLKALQRIHGYEALPIYLTEAIYAPVAPCWLTEREQADYYVRTHLLALASGVVFFGMCTSPYDPGDEYFYSHYGPIGLLHMPPTLNPRESFCAYSTMTGILDRSRFGGLIPVESGSVYGLRFERRRKGPIHALWTIRGRRPAVLACEGLRSPRITDMFGNTSRLKARRGCLSLELTGSPVYLQGVKRVMKIDLGSPVHAGGDGDSVTLAGFHDPSEWRLDRRAVKQLESLGLSVPYRRGGVEVSWGDGEDGPTLHVGPSRASMQHPLEIGYSRLAWRGNELTVPEAASGMGCWIRGNSSWGRVLFALRDANGVELVSIRSDTFIDFDGWRFIRVPLPHGPGGERLEAVGFEPWATGGGAEPEPRYPLTFGGLVLEVRSHISYASELRAVRERLYHVGPIMIESAAD